MKLLYSIFFLLLANLAFGQSDLISAHQIDSVAAAIDTTKNLRSAVADGQFRVKGKKKPTGGFSDTYFVLPDNKQLVKVDHGETLYRDNFASYYFYNDNLILVKTEFHDVNPISVRNNRYYFYKGMLFFKQEQGKPINKPEAFLNHAAGYLEDAKGLLNQ